MQISYIICLIRNDRHEVVGNDSELVVIDGEREVALDSGVQNAHTVFST